MTWVRLDDRFDENPKICQTSDEAFRTYVESLAYAGRALSDGFLPARLFEGRPGVKELVRLTLWERVAGGFQIHDWTDYNPPAAETKERRRRDRERKRSTRKSARSSDQTSDDASARTGARSPIRPAPAPAPVPEDQMGTPGIGGVWGGAEGSEPPPDLNGDVPSRMLVVLDHDDRYLMSKLIRRNADFADVSIRQLRRIADAGVLTETLRSLASQDDVEAVRSVTGLLDAVAARVTAEREGSLP